MKVRAIRRYPSEFGSNDPRPVIEAVDHAQAFEESSIQELPAIEALALKRHGTDWRICLAVAVAGGVVGFGFVGSFDAPRPDDPPVASTAPSSAAVEPVSSPALPARMDSLKVTTPAAGSTVDGGLVEVRATAARALGSVRLSIMIEGETLGAATIEVPAAGRLTTSIPIFGPTKTVGAELVASWPSGDRAPIVGRRHARLEIRQALFLAPAGPIGLWSARVTGDTCGQVVANGFAPLDDRELTIRLIDRTGVMVAKTTAAVATNLGIAGAVAGTGLGFGSYVASLRPVRQLAGGGYRLEIDWHGPLEGDWGTSTFLVWIDRGALRDPNVAC